ncbi:MAG: phospholipase D family protein [Halioglobus sp.]
MKSPDPIPHVATGLRRALILFIVTTLCACASIPPNEGLVASTAFTDTDNTPLGIGVIDDLTGHEGKTGVILLSTGLDAFTARAILAARAERSLDVQYYLFHRDLSGRLLLHELLKAADRGVRVRLLVDDMDMADTDLGVAIIDAHPNIEMRLFNPFARNRSRLSQYVSRFGSVTRRMHNKSFTADNQMTIIGGRNIGDEYFEADPTIAFADMDALFGGPAVQEVSKSFDLYWNNALSYSVSTLGEPMPSASEIATARENLNQWAASQESSAYIKALKSSDLNQKIEAKSLQFHLADVEIFYDQPEKITASRDKKELHMSQYLAPYFQNARSEVMIISPYFVPGKNGTRILCDMRQRGVNVNILTNSLASTDVSVVHAGYLRYRKKLLKCGVNLFEANSKLVMRDPVAEIYQEEGGKREKKLGLSRSSLHAKMFVFDRQYTFIGSLNLDPRSITENTEIGSIIDSAEIGGRLAKEMMTYIPQIAFTLSLDENGKVRWNGHEEGEAVSYSKEPHTSFFKRLSTQIMRIMPIESQI